MRKTLLLAVLVVLGATTQPARAQFCPGVSPWVFDDVQASDPFCGYITWMAQNGISLGCQVIDANHRLYCPSANVSRSQMSAFMSRLGDGAVFKRGGNAFGATAVLGTTDNNALDVRANSSRVMRYEPNAISPNLIGGSPANSVTAGVRGATIGGGGVPAGNTDPDFSNEAPNSVTDAYGTVGGGYANRAGDGAGTTINAAFATVAGGMMNTASALGATVGGGITNVSDHDYATVGGGLGNAAIAGSSTIAGGSGNVASALSSSVVGGSNNVASGLYSTVLGGQINSATHVGSVAAGDHALSDQDGCFVYGAWSALAGAKPNCLGTSNVVRFMVDHGFSVDYLSARADGGGNRWVYIGDLFAGKAINTWGGAYLSDPGTPNSGQWVSVSDVAGKTDFRVLDHQDVLARVAQMPVMRWRYKGEPEWKSHVGPTAQDFWAAFQLGDDDRHIGTIDEGGVALAAIQGLNAKLEAQAREIADLKAAHATEIADLKRAIEVLLARTSPEGRMAAK
ncbi:MAG: tail fiber domain-containing protein [Burkholderiales bacterium]